MSKNEVSEKVYFTVQRQKEVNGEGYKPTDIRTYKVPPMKSSPAGDIACHCAMPESPTDMHKYSSTVTTNTVNFLGHWHDQSTKRAADKVMHFPKASELDTVMLLNAKRFTTLYPSWMVERYGLENLNRELQYTQRTPIYVDKSSSKFAIFMDESFLDEVSFRDLVVGLSREEEGFVSTYTSKGSTRQYLAFVSESYGDFFDKESKVSGVIEKVYANYLSLFVSAQNTEKMLVIWMRNREGDLKSPFTTHSQKISTLINNELNSNSLSIELSFAVVARRDKTFYPINDDGVIQTRCPFFFSRKHTQYGGTIGGGFGGYYDENEASRETHLLLPYCEVDHKLLVSVVERLNALRKELMSFFKRAELDKGSLADKSLQCVLEDYSVPTPLLPFVSSSEGK